MPVSCLDTLCLIFAETVVEVEELRRSENSLPLEQKKVTERISSGISTDR